MSRRQPVGPGCQVGRAQSAGPDGAGGVRLLRRCVVAGGAGAVGGMFAGLLARSGAEVCVIDPACPADGPPGSLPDGSLRSAQGAPPRYLPGAPRYLPDTPLRYLPGDLTAPDRRSLAELGAADLVLLALPEPVALAAAGPVGAAVRPGTLIAETLSVKSRIAATLPAAAPQAETLGLNPMFAPALGIAGRPVAAVTHHVSNREDTNSNRDDADSNGDCVNESGAVNGIGGASGDEGWDSCEGREGGGWDRPGTAELLRLVTEWGGRVVRLDAGRHDRITAATQALTHATVLAFGFALAELGFAVADLAELAPPPHSTLLSMLARIVSANPEVYHEVQAANQHAALARQALANGVDRLTTLVEAGEPASSAGPDGIAGSAGVAGTAGRAGVAGIAGSTGVADMAGRAGVAGFASAFEQTRDLFADQLEAHRRRCAQVFNHLHSPEEK